jgi:hypothetical protein
MEWSQARTERARGRVDTSRQNHDAPTDVAQDEDVHAGRLAAYGRAVDAAFARAAAARPLVTRRLQLGPVRLGLRFAGPALVEPLTAALGHLGGGDGEAADLEVRIWDTESTGVELPRPPWPGGPVIRGFVPGYGHGDVLAALDPAFGAFTLLRGAERLAVYHLASARTLPAYETAFPLRTLWNWWLAGRGLQIVHAGAVGDGRGAALLAGPGGSGKSNTTLACLEAGLEYLGDDYVAVEIGEPAVAHTLFSSAKLFPSDLPHFPGLARALAHAGGDGDHKAVLFLARSHPAAVPRSRPVRAILLPRVARAARTEIVPVTAAAALRAMSPTTLFQLPGAGAAEFRAMGALVRAAPAFELRLGADRGEVVDRLRRFLAEGAHD